MTEDASGPIFHIALESAWHAARSGAGYRMSTLGLTVDEVGFVHAAFADQVDGVYERFYAAVTEPLVLLVIDPGRLRAPVELALDESTGERFPHILGPIDRAAVVAVRPLPAEPERDDLAEPAAPAAGRPGGADWRVLAAAGLLVVLLLGLLIGYALGAR